LRIHFVRSVQIGVEPVVVAVCEYRDPCSCHGEVAEQLCGVFKAERFADLFALDQDRNLIVIDDSEIDLLALLHSHIRDELWDDLCTVEDVETQNTLDERHYQRRFRSFLGIEIVSRPLKFGRQEDRKSTRLNSSHVSISY